MKSLYTLLIGINEYSNPRNNLSGCVNDVQYLDEFLQAYFNNNEFVYKPKILLNQEATRENIIQGFAHFDLAKDGDICLLHYSGHGSQCPSPAEFVHLDPDGKHETLVCHDSRSPEGRDLFDKELSFLIWQATKNKNVHFVASMDCCHSGTNTRSELIRPRRFSTSGDKLLKVEDYLGFESYSKSPDGKYTPPRGQHVLLAAARDQQTAKEVYAGGEPRGIFTYCLLDALKEFQCQITYTELINRLRLRIRNKVSDQSPQLESTHSTDQDLFFLSKESAKDTSFFLAYHKSNRNWQLNAGALHGLLAEPGNEPISLEVESYEKELSIDEIFPVYSTVSGAEQLDKNKVYKARMKKKKLSPIKLAFAAENDPAGEAILKDAIQNFKAITFQFLEDPRNSDYLLHAKQDHFFLTKLDEITAANETGERPSLDSIHAVFKKIKNYTAESSKEFLHCLEKIVKWKQVLELKNLKTGIQDTEIELVLSHSTFKEPAAHAISFEETDWQNPAYFDYHFQDGKWHRPMFQLKIKNKSNRPLWLSLLYCSDNFDVNNVLLPKHHISPGEEVGASYTSRGTTQFNIPLQIEKHYLEKGITNVLEYLKLFISTDEFETSMFNQKGIEYDRGEGSGDRSLALDEVDFPDWSTKEIAIKIRRDIASKDGVENV